MNKLTIAMVAACPFPANRGTPSRILGMAESLAASGHTVHVVTYHFGIHTETKGITIHRIPRMPYHFLESGPTWTKLILLDPLLFFKLMQVIRKIKIDIIHAHHFEGAAVAYMARKLTGIKVIYDAHTALSKELHLYHFYCNKWITYFFETNIPKWADHIVTVSESLKNFIKNLGVVKNGISVIPTGTNIYNFNQQKASGIKEKYNLNNKSIVMYTGSLSPFQQIENLIKAMRKISDLDQNTMLVIVTGSQYKEVSQLCRRHGVEKKVVFAREPSFEKVPEYLAAADVVVIPRLECPGVPQKLLNYMAAEKPIVCFKGSGELLTDQVSGLLVDDGNIDDFAGSIIKLLSDQTLQKKLAKNAKSEAANRYDWKILSKKLEQVYHTLLID